MAIGNLEELFKSIDTEGMDMYSNDDIGKTAATGVAGMQEGGITKHASVYYGRVTSEDTVYNYIQAMSHEGEYPVLTSVPRIASQLGLSQMTVTRALKNLVALKRIYRYSVSNTYIYSIHEVQDMMPGTVHEMVLL